MACPALLHSSRASSVQASESIHSMVQRVAEAWLEVADFQPGVRGAPKSRAAQVAGLVGHVKRNLSISTVKQTSRLLLDRLQPLGEGAAEAAARRDRSVMAEAVAARERRAQEVCTRQGRGIVRRGFGLLERKKDSIYCISLTYTVKQTL